MRACIIVSHWVIRFTPEYAYILRCTIVSQIDFFINISGSYSIFLIAPRVRSQLFRHSPLPTDFHPVLPTTGIQGYACHDVLASVAARNSICFKCSICLRNFAAVPSDSDSTCVVLLPSNNLHLMLAFAPSKFVFLVNKKRSDTKLKHCAVFCICRI